MLMQLFSLTRRNIKLYFKDKITFFMSLITPLILLLLFVLFLKRVYVSSLTSILDPLNISVSGGLQDSFVTSWLVSSILSTSTISVSFCSATLMVSDKINRSIQDIDVAPVHRYTKYLSYLLATFLSTMIIMSIILVLGFGYIACIGWFMSFMDVLQIIASTVLLSLFGSTLACVIFSFIKTQGGTSAVATMVSSCYGFMSGAYMPLSQYPAAMASLLGLNPGVYGNCLLKHGFMRGCLSEMQTSSHIPQEAIDVLYDSFDLNFYFFDQKISLLLCFIILIGITVILLGLYLALSFYKKKRKVHCA